MTTVEIYAHPATGTKSMNDLSASDLHKNYIGGEWVDGEAAPDINPSNTDEIVGHYARATAGDVKNAIAAAKAALPSWSRSGIQQRHDILKAASDEILKRREEIGAGGHPAAE